MSDDNLEEITDPIEQKAWDEAVDINVDFAQSVQRLEFYKYKLRVHLTNNQSSSEHNSLNNNQSLLRLSNTVDEVNQSVNEEYKNSIDKLKASQAEHKDNQRIEIMLSTAGENLKSIKAYAEYHGPNPASLKKTILTLPAEEQAAPSPQNPNESGPAAQ